MKHIERRQQQQRIFIYNNNQLRYDSHPAGSSANRGGRLHKRYLILSIYFLGLQGWRSGESTRLPPMWHTFDSSTRHHMWVEFVGSLLCTERFSPGTPVSPLLKNQHLTCCVNC